MSCPICSNSMSYVFTTQVLSKYEASYKLCNCCGYLMVEKPFWLEEAYADAIARADTGLVMRNISIASKLAGILYFVLKQTKNNPCIDVAGGYGLLTRLMRDVGFNFYWQDAFCRNCIAPGFEYSSSVGSCESITAMEVMEHLEDPIQFIRDQLEVTGAKHFIFTTELFDVTPPAPGSWWYYAFETGQHIGFFQRKTLEKIAQKLNMCFSSAGGIHLFSRAPVNNFIFKIASNRYGAPLIAILVRMLNGSKTMSDHLMMLREIQRGDVQ